MFVFLFGDAGIHGVGWGMKDLKYIFYLGDGRGAIFLKDFIGNSGNQKMSRTFPC